MILRSLEGHKNARLKARGKSLRNDIKACAAHKLDAPLAGYAVVMWTVGGEAVAFWDGTGDLGPVFLEDHVNTILRRQIGMKDAKRSIGIEPEGS